MKDNRCSVLINSCDSYRDIWDPFFHCFNEFWASCPYDIYLNTETLKYDTNFIKVATLNEKKEKCAWGERLRDCLTRINSEYIILLFDDFCLEKPVNQVGIEECIQKMEEDKSIDTFYLINIFPELIDGTRNDFVEVPLKKKYRLNSAPGIWRKSSLLQYTGKPDTPWAWEYFGTFRTEDDRDRRFYVLNGISDYYPYNYRIGGAIHRGRWVKSVIEPIVDRYHLNIDLSVRGFADETEDKNSTWWLMKFFLTGIRMVGFKAFRAFR